MRWNAYNTWSPLLADIKKELIEFSVAKALWTSILTVAMCFKSSEYRTISSRIQRFASTYNWNEYFCFQQVPRMVMTVH